MITVFDREREQSRFRGSTKGAEGEQQGSREGAGESTEGAPREHFEAVQGRSRKGQEMDFPAVQPSA